MPAGNLESAPRFAAAAERNKHPILEGLQVLLPHSGTALEIASGTGQHVVWFAQGLPRWSWQPSDADAAALPALERRIALSALPQVLSPVQLDVMSAAWPSHDAPFTERFDLVFCANMLHISPVATTAALMQGSARHLRPGGLLVTYGPYFEDGPAPAGNLAFDVDLRTRNSAWGVRRLDDVVQEAARVGLAFSARLPMPANNLLLAFQAPAALAAA